MNIARKAFAAAAIAGLGMAGLAATAQAAPPAKPRAFIADFRGTSISPAVVTYEAGAFYTINGNLHVEANSATPAPNAKVTFNTAPGNGAFTCSASGVTNGGTVSGGTITWASLPVGTTDAKFVIRCTFNRAPAAPIYEDVKLTAAGAEGVGTYKYTIDGNLATPKPTTTAKPTAKPTSKPTTPVKDKDSNGGLAKTGF
ncbi:hypothetical protein [Mariniluteicoccus flavus]